MNQLGMEASSFQWKLKLKFMWYERITYPDGQMSVKWTEGNLIPAELKIRINSYEDLILVKSLTELRHIQGEYPKKLFIPCLFGQRSDVRFSEHQSFDLKIITDIINSCEFKEVTIFDPHSTVSLALINNSRKLGPDEYVQRAWDDMRKKSEGHLCMVSPDAGAFKKVFGLGAKFNLPVLGANKHRDLEGNINLTFAGDVKDKTCLIVDDLADGGYTFIVLGNELKKRGAKKVYLYVSHAYFNKGFDELKKSIDGIYCTNSVKDIQDEFVTQYKII